MTLEELYENVLTIVADYRLNYDSEFSEHEKRRAIQIFLAFDDYLIDNLPGYCSDDCPIDFGDYAAKMLNELEAL